MNRRLKKIMLLLLAGIFVFGAGRVERSLNRDRETLGLTRTAVLENAPPALAFTTVALGGFRGLISNFLWMRANDLQQDDKFFEAAQLADWITQLEPTYAQVWAFQAWNMAYNISVKFKENEPGVYADRWHWVERGIELLRDDGLRYNPNNILLYRELGWLYQHKMGQNLDDANLYYKSQWAMEMTNLFGFEGTNFGPLLHPQTPADRQRLNLLTNRFKLDPEFVQEVDTRYGPFDWLLPEAHGVYWGAKALDEAARQPDKVSKDDLIIVRRLIYQSELQAFRHGRVIANPFNGEYSLGPNLDLVSRANDVYTNMYNEEVDPAQKDGILKAHRNFVRDAVYMLYEAGRTREAQNWFNYLRSQYPDKPIVESQPNSLPKNLTLDQYAVAVAQIDISETSQERVTAAIEGIATRAYVDLMEGDDAGYQNMINLARGVHAQYDRKATSYNENRIKLLPMAQMESFVVRHMVMPSSGLPYSGRATLATRLGLPASLLNAPAPGLNAAEEAPTNAVSTNAVAPAGQ